jgi:hypothetical protein
MCCQPSAYRLCLPVPVLIQVLLLELKWRAGLLPIALAIPGRGPVDLVRLNVMSGARRIVLPRHRLEGKRSDRALRKRSSLVTSQLGRYARNLTPFPVRLFLDICLRALVPPLARA